MEHPLLSLHEVTKTRGSFALLRDIDMTVSAGEISAVIGPEASGKSTLLQLIAGLIRPKSGEIAILGNAPTTYAARASVAYAPDVSALPTHLTITELIKLYEAMFADFDRDHASLLFSELRVKTDKRIGAMSRSTRELVQLILTLSRRAHLYLLDNPLFGSPAAKEFALRLIREAKREDAAILITAEEPSDVEAVADTFFFLSEGRVILSGNVNTYRTESRGTLTEEYRRMLS